MQTNFSLKKYNTFGLDVRCKFFAQYCNINELKEILQQYGAYPILHIGSGSNLLFLKDFNGLILHSAIKFTNKSESDDYYLLEVGAGVIWDDLCKYAVINNIGGFENLSLIPGEVGAAAVQNIGAYGVEVKDLIESVNVLEISTMECKTFSNKECEYNYRESVFKTRLKDKYIILSVSFKISKNIDYNFSYKALKERVGLLDKINLSTIRETIIKIRESKLPSPEQYGNAGSFFKNPIVSSDHFAKLQKEFPDISFNIVDENNIKLSSAWLIDNCGLKGYSIGGAQVYKNQPLVIINYSNASANDIKKLADYIIFEVNKKYNICLEPEVIYINY